MGKSVDLIVTTACDHVWSAGQFHGLPSDKQYCCRCKEVRVRPSCEHMFTRIPGLKVQHCWLCGYMPSDETEEKKWKDQ